MSVTFYLAEKTTNKPLELIEGHLFHTLPNIHGTEVNLLNSSTRTALKTMGFPVNEDLLGIIRDLDKVIACGDDLGMMSRDISQLVDLAKLAKRLDAVIIYG